MKWMIPVNELDEVQTRSIENILENLDENHWVKGFAGSGKTIVLTHVLERLANAKPQRKVCFATFTHALKDLVESGLSLKALNSIEISTFNGLGKLRDNFDLIVADELQDIPSRVLPTLQSKADVLVVAADLDQSIFRSACSESELNRAIKPAREHQLRDIHRINENVFDIATAVYSDAKIVSKTTVRQDDEQARIYEGSSVRDEFITMFNEAVRVSSREHPSAVLLPSRALIDSFISTVATSEGYTGTPPSVRSSEKPDIGETADPFKETNAFLKKNKSPLQVFGSGGGSISLSDKQKVVYLMTYHSAKGLDFSNVFLPHLTSDVSLEPMKGSKDDQERRLFFVAVTRARERLYLSFHGEPHRFLEDIPEELLQTFRKQKRSY